jgi:hypothetical protein
VYGEGHFCKNKALRKVNSGFEGSGNVFLKKYEGNIRLHGNSETVAMRKHNATVSKSYTMVELSGLILRYALTWRYAAPEFNTGVEASKKCLIATSLLLPDTRSFRHGLVAAGVSVLFAWMVALVSARVLGSVVCGCAGGCAECVAEFDVNAVGGAVRLR